MSHGSRARVVVAGWGVAALVAGACSGHGPPGTADAVLWPIRAPGLRVEGSLRAGPVVRRFAASAPACCAAPLARLTAPAALALRLELVLRAPRGDTLLAVRRTYPLAAGKRQSLAFLVGGPDPRADPTALGCVGAVEAVPVPGGADTLWLMSRSMQRDAVC